IEALERHAAALRVEHLLVPDLIALPREVEREIETEGGAILHAGIDHVRAGPSVVGQIATRSTEVARLVDRVVRVDVEALHREDAHAELAADLLELLGLVRPLQLSERIRLVL